MKPSDVDALLVSQDTRGVLTLTLNRPHVRNAFDDALITALIAALQKAAQDPTVRVVILRGNGSVFCAGADLQWMQRMIDYTYEENLSDASQLALLMETLHDLPQPTLAVVQGAAYGGGVGLLACCDLVIAEISAKFCLSEVKLGLIPAVISPFLLVRMGQKALRRYAFTAEVFDASKAQANGLVDECVPTDELELHADAMLKNLLAASPAAIREMKQLLQRLSESHRAEEIQAQTIAAIARIRISEEGQEGLKAFLEKRKPNYQIG